MTQQEINELIEDYTNGMTLNKTTKKYHHTMYTIKAVLEENGIHVRNRSEAGTGARKVHIPDDIGKEIIKNYNNGIGMKACGEPFHIGPAAVRSYLVENNVQIRNKSEAAKITNVNRKILHCNEDYFKTQTSNMVYILGFLAADGSVGKNSNVLKITLAEKDSELLEKIKQEFEFTGEIKHKTTSKGFDIAVLDMTCAEYKKDLAKYNIIPQKTFTFSIPDNIEKQYMIDFIRGYWDGDGTICTAGKSAIRSSVCSARKETIEQILEFLEKEYDIPKVSIQIKPGLNPLYYIQYSNTSTRKLCDAFYYSDNVLCLERKKKKFFELCR